MTVTADVSIRPKHRLRARLVGVAGAAVLVGTSVAVVGPAGPALAATPTQAQLSLTGVSSSRYPTGGNIVWVQPGGSVTFSAAPVSIAANQGPVLGLIGSLLGGLVGLQSSANLSSVHLGTRTLTTSPANSVTTPALQQGVYPFTWSMTKVLGGLLGTSTQGVNLNGNQAKSLGIALNASNQYVGYVYVSTTPPPSGFSIQLPTISVAPSLPVVGQLPTITVPGTTVTLPGVSVPGQSDAPTTGSGGSTAPGAPTTGTTAPGSTSTSASNPYGYTAPGCTGPCLVVPKGGGGGGTVGAAYDVTLGDLGAAGIPGVPSAGSGSGAGGSSGSGVDQLAAGSGNGTTVDPAFDQQAGGAFASGAPLPTGLAIGAIVALAAAVLLYTRQRLARR